MTAPLVQVGRVVLVTYGPDAGKLATVVDIVDHNRVLVDGPTTGVKRQVLSFKRLSLTKIVLENIPRTIGSGALAKKVAAQDLEGKWNATARAQKLAQRTTRANLSDFGRFKVYLLRKKASAIKNKIAKSVKV
ncbi:ribosomal protein L14-domain-containing protein [Blastocladiella britannica]|nr:ribosomal protein L14-domain-containing protein [Blastocladiella britannica]